ncbi:MAG: ATP-binding cassette domain-containing protein [Gammaproteobacteria bacterium]|nr:ATP-binding cassette domain-containing protein [Gammaproteobacteria bacterium]MDE0178580.1 ATP-binding cassette domain-containing protein [Gammaproteobacteria bacterium]MDE0443483.1 ATP-binding cassette domain-containing protein [Gammaproteobacteria bacterium]
MAVSSQSASDSSALVKVDSLRRSFPSPEGDEVHALRDVTLRIDASEFVCIVGASGAGKTTLLHILGCLDRPSSGAYHFAGQSVSALDESGLADVRLNEIGFVFQDHPLLEAASALRNVELPATYLDVGATERRERAMKLLRSVGLEDRAEHLPAELSGGKRQRVGIARALMNDPCAILADEPTGGLDSKQAGEVLSLREELASRGAAVIVVSHDPGVAARAHRVVRLTNGRIASDAGENRSPGPESDRRRRPRRRSPWSALAAVFAGLRGGGYRTVLMALAALAAVWMVVALTGYARDASQAILATAKDMGANRITVLGTAGLEEEGRWRNVERIDLTMDDVALIEPRIDNADRVIPSVLDTLPVRRDDRVLKQVVVVSLEEPPHRTVTIGNAVWDVELGFALTADDSENRRQAIVIGPTIREALFDRDEDPLGAYVLVGDLPFEVKGVLGPFPTPGLYPADLLQDEEWTASMGAVAHVPFKTATDLLYGTEALSMIEVEADDPERIPETIREIRDMLVQAHGGREGVVVFREPTLAETYATMSRVNAAVLAAVGALSLLAAGLVVLSLMLVAVGTRRQEIGLRLAVGARKRDVQLAVHGGGDGSGDHRRPRRHGACVPLRPVFTDHFDLPLAIPP